MEHCCSPNGSILFDMKRRIPVDLDFLDFGVMRKLFEVGDVYLEELDRLKAESKLAASSKGAKKKRLAGDSLRERDPWL